MENNIQEKLKSIENLLLFQKVVLTIDEAAQYTGLAKSYLYKLTSGNKIPHYKPHGKTIYFKKLEIDEWLLQNRVETLKELDVKANTHLALKKGGKN